MSLFDDAITSASKAVNSVLGAYCLYQREYDGRVFKDVSVIFDKNKPVTNEFNVLVSYRVEASILKEQISLTRVGDIIVDDVGSSWRITSLMKETRAKWYVDVIRL